MDTESCGCGLLQVLTLIRYWSPVAERRMQPLAIIKPFDILKHGAPCRRVTGKDGQWQFGLQGGKEALHCGIVPAVAFATHTALHLALYQERLILSTGILAASITMVEQAR